jgi:hypothetical protein
MKRISILLISAGLFFIFHFKGFSQEFSFREYGVGDGLPQSQAIVIYQDSRGFIWIQTRNGLSRFDGIDFINYHLKEGLPSNLVQKVFEDSASDLWALTREGLSKFTGERFIFYPAAPDFQISGFSPVSMPSEEPAKVFLLAEKVKGLTMRIVFFDGKNYKDYSSRFKALDSLKVSDLIYDTIKNEMILLDKSQHLWSWKENKLSKLSDRIFNNITYERGKIILYSDDIYYEYKNGRVSNYIPENYPGRSDVRIIQKPGELAARYFNGFKLFNIMLPFKAHSCFIDKDNTVWFSSENNIFRLVSTAYQSWSDKYMNIAVPWAICPDKYGNLLIGSLYSDLLLFNGSVFKNRNDYKKTFKRDLYFYKGSRLLSNGESWVSANTGVLVWDGKSFSRLQSIPDSLQICYIYEDPDDKRIMIGTDKGVYVIMDGKVTHLDQFVPGNLGVIEGIVKDDSGFYWMSGQNGVVRYYGVSSVKVIDDVLPEFYTYTIEKDRSGGIWVSSEEGLFFKGREERNFSHGIPAPFNKPANSVKILDRSHLLVGRITDFCIIDLDKFYNGGKDYYRVYDTSDGYPGGECLDNGIVVGKDGIVWILTSKNLVRFDHSLLRKNEIPPSVKITGIYYETDSLTWEPVRMGEFYYGIPSDIRLKREDFNVRITFTGISTSNPEKVSYQYMLRPTDEKWSLPFKRRELVFRNLQPGEYTFLLKGINADKFETPEPVILKFTIAPAYWETNIFRFILILVILSLTVFITRYIIRRRHRLNEEKQKLKSELIRLQMNSFLKEFDPHFTFNALSSVGALIMKNERQAAYLYLTRLSSLLRASLRDSSLIVKPLSQELDFVRNYCELQKLRFGERFNYDIQIGEGVDMQKEIPKMTIQTFIENSIKHGIENRREGGKIEIILSHEGENHIIIIKDNGIGRTASHSFKSGGMGYGIRTIQRIFEIINKNNLYKSTLDIRDFSDNEFSSGTEVVIKIPDIYSFRIENIKINSEEDELKIDM